MADGATISGTVSIAASATDDQGVQSMKLYIDGSLKASSSTASLSYSWNTKRESDGSHTITVEAADTSANRSQTTVQVLKGGGSTGGGKGGGRK